MTMNEDTNTANDLDRSLLRENNDNTANDVNDVQENSDTPVTNLQASSDNPVTSITSTQIKRVPIHFEDYDLW